MKTQQPGIDARIVGIGAHRPRRIVSNDASTARTGRSDDWIRRRTGIMERRCAEPDETVSSRGAAGWRRVSCLPSDGSHLANDLARNVHPVIWERSADRCRSAQVISHGLPSAASVAWKSRKGAGRCRRPARRS